MAVESKILTIEQWIEIQKRLDLLDALEAAGVDNWEGYDYALEILEKGGEEEDLQ